ncbi:MAG: ANTAR domain-containing protein [Methylococcaceae bacterium]|nr:ANTAR domain-containing protein [Methylococcaceae bacterium]
MLKVLLVESDINTTLLVDALTNNGFNILKARYSPLFLSLVKESRPDVIVIALDAITEDLITDLHTLNQQLPLPVIVFSRDDSIETINKVIQAEVSAYIVDGLAAHRVNSIIQVAVARFKQRQTMKDALEEARAQLEDRRQIDRAKAILIKTQNFSEHEAYHTLRKLAMDRNITVGEMARNVIAMAELLK